MGEDVPRYPSTRTTSFLVVICALLDFRKKVEGANHHNLLTKISYVRSARIQSKNFAVNLLVHRANVAEQCVDLAGKRVDVAEKRLFSSDQGCKS